VAGFGAFDRDSGLRRVSRVTKWLVAGSVAAVGIVTAVVAEAAPGSSRTTTPTPTPTGAVEPAPGPTTTQPRIVDPGTDPGTVPGTIGPAPPSDRGLTPPTDPPQPTRRRHIANSGGS
jgi:hypothetical protein